MQAVHWAAMIAEQALSANYSQIFYSNGRNYGANSSWGTHTPMLGSFDMQLCTTQVARVGNEPARNSRHGQG